MKFIAAILALLIAALPVPAGACASFGGDATAIGAEQPDTGDGGHDCCPGGGDAPPEADDPACDGSDHCGRCMAPGGVVTAQFVLLPVERPESAFAALQADVFPSHDAPPFRPPIA